MPVSTLNNVSTQDNYVDALTVAFSIPRTGFSAQVSNAAALYQLAVVLPGERLTGNPRWEYSEHYRIPSLLTFNDVTREGFPHGALFAGIRWRSAVTGTPATVSVA